MSIIALVGYIGCGKGTVANILVNDFGFVQDSFASPVKDVCSSIFGWPRHLLEGDTIESREWRETIDEWWSEKLNIPNFTPRKALQTIGTDVLRDNFNDGIWFLSLLRRQKELGNSNIVISDARFFNEIEFIKKIGGKVVRITRGPDPEWYQIAADTNHGKSTEMFKRTDVPKSEWSWAGAEFDYVIDNNGTLQHLHAQVYNLFKNR